MQSVLLMELHYRFWNLLIKHKWYSCIDVRRYLASRVASSTAHALVLISKHLLKAVCLVVMSWLFTLPLFLGISLIRFQPAVSSSFPGRQGNTDNSRLWSASALQELVETYVSWGSQKAPQLFKFRRALHRNQNLD